MSIKKCIMNYFDKATNAMIPFHPQTESAAHHRLARIHHQISGQ